MSLVGTFRTWSDVRLESVVRTKADSADYYRFMGSRPNIVGIFVARRAIPHEDFDDFDGVDFDAGE
jgi:hypothetical protein